MIHPEWKVQKIICRAVLEGRSDEVFVTYNVPLIDQTIYRRLADDALSDSIRRRAIARRYFRAPIRNPIVVGQWLSGLIALGALAMAVHLWRVVELQDPQTYAVAGTTAAFCAIAVAAVGWGISGWITHRTARSKLTMDVVAARYAQSAFGDAISAFNKVLKGRRIDGALIAALDSSDEPDDRAAVQGLRYLLNYFEFIAVGVLGGELDERIVAKTLRGNLNFVYERSFMYVAELQKNNPRTLEHFTTLCRHYRDL